MKKGNDNGFANNFSSNTGQPLIKRLNKNSSIFAPSTVQKNTLQLKPTVSKDQAKQAEPDYKIVDYNNISNESDFKATVHYIKLLADKNTREEAFKQLNNKRDSEPNIASLLWHSVGTISVLLQEIISIYPYLTSLTLTSKVSERICNVLGLFQCIALDPKTRILFLKGKLNSQLASLCLSSN